MDNKRLDEAVEVALSAVAALDDDAWPDDYDADDRRVAQETMRAALLASLPVLLGEVATYGLRRKGSTAIIGVIPQKVHDHPPSQREYLEQFEEVPLYAPSLGEGDESES